MAEKQYAFSGSGDREFFADDDPLAELARIVGFEPKPVSKPAPTPERRPSVLEPVAPITDIQREPEFDLEDELLREFELYDEPPAIEAPVDTTVAAAEAVAPAVEPEPVEEPETAEEPVPAIVADRAQQVAHLEEPVVSVTNRIEPTLGDDDTDADFLAMLAQEDLDMTTERPASRQDAAVEHHARAVEAVSHSVEVPEFVDADDAVDDHDLHDLHDLDDLPEWPSANAQASVDDVDQSAQAAVETTDLADELERSIVEQPVVPVAAAVTAKAVAEEPRLRLSLANFNVPRTEPRVEPRSETLDARAAIAQPADLGFMPEHDRHEDVAEPVPPVVAKPVEAAVVPEPLEIETESEPLQIDEMLTDELLGDDMFAEELLAADLQLDQADETLAPETGSLFDTVRTAEPGARAPADQTLFSLDDLMADVSRYPVPPRAGQPAVKVEPQIEPRVQTSWERATATVAALQPQPVTRDYGQVDAVPVARQETLATVADRRVDPEPALDERYADQDIQLNFEDIELDLSDMSFDEPAPPIRAAAVPVDVPVATATTARREPEVASPDWTSSFSNPSFTSSYETGAADKAPLDADGDAYMPFDPSLISESEDHVESLAEMDVPALPVVEVEEPVALQPEYDLDIDAEMANLLDGSHAAAQTQTRSMPVEEAGFTQASWAAAPQVQAQPDNRTQTSFDEFDDFERALEEDFRRTLTEPLGRDSGATKMTLEPGGYLASEKKKTRSSRGMLIAASLVAVVGLGAVGAYAWLGGGSDVAGSSSGPRVIVADNQPVKVVPENKGGRTVPNQDKAVYDRVAGNTTEDLKQNTLVSSSEEPVDVVQKTLIPENLPLEGDDEPDAAASATPVGETEDTRLLPNETAAVVADEKKTPGVSPRKVRTMVVRADGTLVAREVSADPVVAEADATQPVAQDTAVSTSQLAEPTVKAEPLATQDAVVETPLATPEVASTAGEATPVQTLPVTDTTQQPSDATLSDVANSDVQSDPPVRVVKTTKIEDKAPIPTTRPVDQPVNIVGTVTDQGNVRPADTQTAAATTETAEKPVEVASVAAGTYVMQVASLPSEAEAQKSYANLQKKFGSVIGGRGVDIKKAEIAGKGTFYRVRIPVGTKDEAAALCVKFRAAGGSCLISK